MEDGGCMVAGYGRAVDLRGTKIKMLGESSGFNRVSPLNSDEGIYKCPQSGGSTPAGAGKTVIFANLFLKWQPLAREPVTKN